MPRPATKRRLGNLEQENPMNVTHYIGFDGHKKHINFCSKTEGALVEEGRLQAQGWAVR